MKGFKKISINRQKLLSMPINSLKRLLWFLARDAFLFLLVLVLASVVFVEFLFYNNVLLLELKKVDEANNVVRFKEDTYVLVVEQWKIREDTFNRPLEAIFDSPFYEPR